MSNQINSYSECNKCENCKEEDAVIFHDSGEFCIDCWNERTHPDIPLPAVQMRKLMRYLVGVHASWARYR